MSAFVLSIVLPLAILALAIGWGFFLGMRRTRARFFVVLGCLAFAIVMTVCTKSITYADLAAQITPAIGHSGSETLRDAWDMVQDSPAMQDILVSGGMALAAPLIFTASFVAASVVTWIICYIIFIIAAIVRAASGKRRRRLRPVRTVLYATLQWVITLFVLLTPIACYISGLPEAVEIVADAGLLEKANVSRETADRAVDGMTKAPLLKAYNAVGGKKVTEAMTSFRVNGQKTTIGHEMTALTRFGVDLYRLTECELKNYGKGEADIIRNVGESFEDSAMLSSIGGEFIYFATDAWKNGDKFIGTGKPDLTQDRTTGMFADTFDHILDVLNADARNPGHLGEDFSTLAGLVEIMARDGVFGTMRQDGTDDLVNLLSNGSTVADMVKVLQANERFSVVVTDLTSVGMRFIAESLQLPENGAEIYQNFTVEIADAMNRIKAEGMTAEELTAELRTALDNTDVEFTTADSVLELYANALLEETADKETVTADDIAGFFEAMGLSANAQ